MSGFIIEARDPILFRDGRPNDGRSQSRTLPFPFPSTVAGLCRTRFGSAPGRGFVLEGEAVDRLLQLELRGPLLASSEGDAVFVPAPRDAVITNASEDARVYLRPLYPIDPGPARFDGAVEVSDWRWMGQAAVDQVSGKPPANLPRFWSWASMLRWLEGDGLRRDAENVSDLFPGGVGAPEVERRTHVALTADGVAEEGKLFGTEGLRFVDGGRRPLGLLVDAAPPDSLEAPTGGGLLPGIGPAAGERRLARWRESKAWATLDAIPDRIRAVVRGEGQAKVRVRAVLLTPGAFEAGWRPSKRSPLLEGGIARLIAAAVPRPESQSGWDVSRRRPKPTRRLVSSGSVYVLELGGDPDARERWLQEVWMKNVSDELQARRDGYGLCAIGCGVEEES